MDYTCKRCEYSSPFKHALQRHLKNKKECTAKSQDHAQDLSRETLLKELSLREYSDVTYECPYCKRKFNHRSTKSRHLPVCKQRKSSLFSNQEPVKDCDENLVKRIEELEKHLASQVQTVPQIQNINNGTIVVNNNVSLRNFGEENNEAIPLPLVRSTYMNLEFNTVFENLHCDPDYPENHNVRIKSYKRELIEIYKNNKWNSLCFSDGFREVIQQIYLIFKDYTRKHSDLLNEDMNEDEVIENEEKLDRIFEWIKDTQYRLKQIKEVKQITAALDSMRTY